MIEQAVIITLWGMGGVFAFLTLLIGAMVFLRQVIEKTKNSANDKVAIAIAVAKAQEVA
ncbi:MAG: OadG family protein [Pseudomonadota bacterium]|nr:OadG family protein [Pseudomonadota bacterium]